MYLTFTLLGKVLKKKFDKLPAIHYLRIFCAVSAQDDPFISLLHSASLYIQKLKKV